MLKFTASRVFLRIVGQGIVIRERRGVMLVSIEIGGVEDSGLEGRVGFVLGWICGHAGQGRDGDDGGLGVADEGGEEEEEGCREKMHSSDGGFMGFGRREWRG